jgi:hypothetical protein
MRVSETTPLNLPSSGDRGQSFAELVHRVLTSEPAYDIETVAAAMGMPYHTFYNRLRHQTPFTADEIRRLFAVAPDPRFVHFLLDGTPFMPAERLEEADGASDEISIQRGAERIAFESADILRAAYLAMGDNRIDHREAAQIREEIDTAERALASLKMHLDTVIGRQG